jgi:hypothetical protein
MVLRNVGWLQQTTQRHFSIMRVFLPSALVGYCVKCTMETDVIVGSVTRSDAQCNLVAFFMLRSNGIRRTQII